jgi:hypothetical protein
MERERCYILFCPGHHTRHITPLHIPLHLLFSPGTLNRILRHKSHEKVNKKTLLFHSSSARLYSTEENTKESDSGEKMPATLEEC